MRKVIYIVRILMIELGLTAVRVRDVTRVATARARALEKNNRIEEDMTKPPAEIVEFLSDFSDDQISRMMKLMKQLGAIITRPAASTTGLRAKSKRTKRKVAGSRNGRR